MSIDEDWQRGWNGIAADLAQLLDANTASQPLSVADVEAAAGAHAALVALLARVHRDVAGTYNHDAAPSLRLADEHPVAALGSLLQRHPLLAGAALTDSLLDATTPPGQHWASMGRHVALAEHAWTTTHPSTLPRGDAAWAVVADVAAMTQVLATLDRDLAGHLQRQGRSADAEQLRRAAGSGLRVVAAEVQSVATSGPLPAQRWTPALLTVTPVASTEDLARGQARLADLLRSAPVLTPQDVRTVALQQLRLVLTAAESTAEPRLRAELMRLAVTLDPATTRRPRVRSVDEPDPWASAPVRQAQVLHWFVSAKSDPSPALATTVASTATVVVDALSSAAARNLAQGRWLVPNPDSDQPSAPLWVPSPRGTEVQLLTSLRRAQQQAAVAASVAGTVPAGAEPQPTPQATSPAPPAARTVLAPALLARLQRGADPAEGGRRPAVPRDPRPAPPREAPPRVTPPDRGQRRGR